MRSREKKLFPSILSAFVCIAFAWIMGCGGGSNASTSSTQATPTIGSFVATPQSISAGNASTLSWTVSNASALTLTPSGGTAIDVTGKTSYSVTPTATTTYTLAANNSSASVTSQVIVTVSSVSTPVISAFAASPQTISPGSSSTLSWTTSNASTLTLTPAGGTAVDVTGKTSYSVSPTSTTTYTLTASNGTATVTSQVVITVSSVAAPRIASFAASSTLLQPVTTNSSATLSWSASNATSTTLSPSGGAAIDVSSVTSYIVKPTVTTTYTLTAKNSGGSTTSQVTVEVASALSLVTGAIVAGGSNYASAGQSLCSNLGPYTTDASGNLVAVGANGAVCRIASDGTATLLAQIPLSSSLVLHAAAHHVKASAQRQTLNGEGSSANTLYSTGFSGIVLSTDGMTIYVSDASSHVIRKIALSSTGSATITVLAGVSGSSGYRDGAAAQALFYTPSALALDSTGNLYVVDAQGRCIRKITFSTSSSATVSLYAGSTTSEGYANGAALSARFSSIYDLAMDSNNVLYVDDLGNYAIRRILTAESSPTVSTVAGGTQGFADGTGSAAHFEAPLGLTIASDNSTVYVMDSVTGVNPQSSSFRISDTRGALRKIVVGTNGSGVVTTLAGNNSLVGHLDGAASSAALIYSGYPRLDGKGNIYMITPEPWTLAYRKYNISSGVFTTLPVNVWGSQGGAVDGSNARFLLPAHMAIDSENHIYLADSTNSTIRKVTIASDGTSSVTTLAGSVGVYGYADGTGTAATMSYPLSLALSPDNSALYFSGFNEATVRRIDTTSGVVTTVLGKAGTPGNVDDQGTSSRLTIVTGLAFDSTGKTLYIADAGNASIRALTLSTDELSTLQFTDASGYSVTPAPKAIAYYTNVSSGVSYLYEAETCLIRAINLTTKKSTILAGSSNGCAGSSLGAISDLAVDSKGNLYVADSKDNVVLRVTQAGAISTVLGTANAPQTVLGTAPSSIVSPLGVKVDSSDTLYVTVPNAVLAVKP